MNKRIFAAATFSLWALVAMSAQEAVKIKWTPKAGSVLTYNVKSTASGIQTAGGSGDLSMGALLTHKVVEIKPDGKVIVEEKQGDFSVKIGDTDVSQMLPKEMIETITYAANGETLETKTDPAFAQYSNPRVEGLSGFKFPESDVKVGDTWTRTTKADASKNVFSTTSIYTYQGTEKVGDWDCYKIGVVFRETDAPTNMSAIGTIWLSKADGDLVKSTYKIKNLEIPGMQPVDSEANIMRVS